MATGALLEQSSFTDTISLVRASNNSRTAPEYNAGLHGVSRLSSICYLPCHERSCTVGSFLRNIFASAEKTVSPSAHMRHSCAAFTTRIRPEPRPTWPIKADHREAHLLAGALAGVQEAPGNWNECLQGNGILSKDTTICQATV